MFEFSGIHNALLDEQLDNFTRALSKPAGLPVAKPGNWLAAFVLLTSYLAPLIKSQRKVIFFDEFPWVSTPRSGFMHAFEHSWICGYPVKNLVVIICGSAGAWMIQKVINKRGGLHNRVTRKIRLLPFTIA